jgi:hypothetical protein
MIGPDGAERACAFAQPLHRAGRADVGPLDTDIDVEVLLEHFQLVFIDLCVCVCARTHACRQGRGRGRNELATKLNEPSRMAPAHCHWSRMIGTVSRDSWTCLKRLRRRFFGASPPSSSSPSCSSSPSLAMKLSLRSYSFCSPSSSSSSDESDEPDFSASPSTNLLNLPLAFAGNFSDDL